MASIVTYVLSITQCYLRIKVHAYNSSFDCLKRWLLPFTKNAKQERKAKKITFAFNCYTLHLCRSNLIEVLFLKEVSLSSHFLPKKSQTKVNCCKIYATSVLQINPHHRWLILYGRTFDNSFLYVTALKTSTSTIKMGDIAKQRIQREFKEVK